MELPARESAGLPDDVAAAVRQLAGQLHDVLSARMTVADPDPEVALLWQAAKLINTAAGGLDDGDDSATPDRQLARGWDVADMAAYIARLAFDAAGRDRTVDQAARYAEYIEMLCGEDEVTAGSATVHLFPAAYDETKRPLTVDVCGGLAKDLIVIADGGPQIPTRPHTAASLLRVAHAVHQLGQTLSPLIEDQPAEENTP